MTLHNHHIMYILKVNTPVTCHTGIPWHTQTTLGVPLGYAACRVSVWRAFDVVWRSGNVAAHHYQTELRPKCHHLWQLLPDVTLHAPETWEIACYQVYLVSAHAKKYATNSATCRALSLSLTHSISATGCLCVCVCPCTCKTGVTLTHALTH